VARAWSAAVAALDPSAVGRRDAFRALVAGTVDPEERSVALRDRLRFEQDILRDTEASATVLGLASKDERAAAWVAEASWLEAASRQDAPAAARAHQAIADLCDQPDGRAAHLAASGRCFAVAGDADSAIAVLRQALVHAPAHRYAVPLIAALLREKGELDAVAGVLAAASEADRGGRAAQRRRYAAGAASELEGDAAGARASYEEAAGADPTAEGPLAALGRLADRTSDTALRHGVRARRAAFEQATGRAGWASLEHGEHLHRTGKQDGARLEEASSLVRSSLEVQELGPCAALGLALLGSVRPQDGSAPGVDGLRTLVASAEGAAKLGWLRELGDLKLN
jgi:tetratricopeptide (TPR) repeat protein